MLVPRGRRARPLVPRMAVRQLHPSIIDTAPTNGAIDAAIGDAEPDEAASELLSHTALSRSVSLRSSPPSPR